LDQEIERVYGGKIRVRACGLCWKDDMLLLVNHHHLGPDHFWAPPGGGIELWRSAEQTLKQEFLEETGLEINVGEFQFAAEFIKPPLHAIELFFPVTIVGGSVKKGHDPETKLQLIKEVGFKSFDTIHSIPTAYKHGIFKSAHTPSDLRNLRGYIRLL
jgi:8-oxo-dGTP diphosphatase